jgi:hypothetical protein
MGRISAALLVADLGGDLMKHLVLAPVVLACSGVSGWAAVDVHDLLKKSVAATARNWKEAPNYVFTEHDIEEKLDAKGKVKARIDKTYEVVMMDGSPYNKLLKINGKPLPPDQQKAEDAKLESERQRRLHQSQAERAKRVSRYDKERRQDQAMLREMADALEYKLAGEETVNGRQTYLLVATSKPGYVPKSRDAKVLTAMKGKLWIDKAETQWVKVEAEVVRPVSFYAVATVTPGTKFVFEQQPVGNELWMAKHFSVHVNSNVLWMARNSNQDETYSDYRRVADQAARAKGAPKK